MKKSLYLLACLFLVGTLSCTSDEDTPENVTPTAEKEYTVSLGFSGEITDISEFPLTKASGNDLYGIQVYSCHTDSTTYTRYAYGLFDDVSKMTIKLMSGYKYKFNCTMVVDGKNKIDSYDGYYTYPFHLSASNSNMRTLLNNAFTYSSSDYMDYINACSGAITKKGLYIRPNFDRYYGELSDFTPAENKAVTISMKRVSFGAKFIADGLTEGTLVIDMDEAPEMNIVYPATDIQDIFTINNAWTSDDITDVVSASIYWLKSNNTKIPIATQRITFKRNKMTVITVKVTDSSTTSSLSLNTETTEMTQTDSITINSGTGIDTPVNP